MKPILRGRDVKRFRSKWAGLWMINLPWHFPLHSESSIKGASKEAEKLFMEQYPGIFSHLLSHKNALSSRNKSETGISYEWYALQRWGANYHEDFDKEKLIWMDLTEQGRFTYDDAGMYCLNTTFMMTGESIKYLCAVLNSKVITWFMKNTALNSGMGVTRWIGYTVERIPIPKVSPTQEQSFVQLVNFILEKKGSDQKADTGDFEEELDRLVYELYGLTDEEVSTLEGGLSLSP